jgi:glyoxalase superfamily protein
VLGVVKVSASLVSDPVGAGGSLYFMKVPEPKVGKNRLHLDLVTSGSMEAEVTRLVEAGAELVEVRARSRFFRQSGHVDDDA